MNERDYHTLANTALAQIETQLEAADADFERVAEGIIEVEPEAGGKIVINKQAAMQEIWVAARSGGFHYRWDGAAWRDTRSGEELFAVLARLIA